MHAEKLLIDDRREGHGLEGEDRCTVHCFRVLFLTYNAMKRSYTCYPMREQGTGIDAHSSRKVK